MTKQPKLPPPTTDGLPPRLPTPVQRGCLAPGCTGKHQARGLCKACYRKAHYQANKERSLLLNRKWHADNPEKSAALRSRQAERQRLAREALRRAEAVARDD